MAIGDFERYYALNPIQVWDRNQWDAVHPAIATAFRQNALFTPLIDWVPLSQDAAGSGTTNPVSLITGREALPGHANHDPINVRAKYIEAAYMDSRERQLYARYRYGGKIQLESYDRLINMWQRNGTQGFIDGILRTHLNNSIVQTNEKIARDGLLTRGAVTTYAGGASDASGLAAQLAYTFDPTVLRDVKLRLSVRARWAIQQFGDYADPLPGSNMYMVITTPGVFHSIFDNLNHEYVQRHTVLQNRSILNMQVVEYEGFLFVQSWDAALWNAGPITKQVAVTSAINAGDGAPDPDVTSVDNVWKVGQSSSTITHYIQCSDFDSGDFNAGDFVTIHTARSTDLGVTDGVDVTSGYTQVAEVYSADDSNNRLVLRSPVMTDYVQSFPYTTLAGGASSGTGYAFVTKGLHLQPLYIFGARGGLRFAMRQPLQFHNPPAVDDFESVTRVSWDLFGELNTWNPDLWEVHMAVGSFGNRGGVTLA